MTANPSPEHVHYLGPDNLCACGYRLVIPRFCFSMSLTDNDIQADILNEGYNTTHLSTIISDLRKFAEELERKAR